MKRTAWVWIVLLGAALFRYTPPMRAEEELIVPDGVEYAIGGLQLLQGKIPLLRMEGGAYPPRFFFGYSLLTVPFYVLFGRQLGNAVFTSLFLVSVPSFFCISLWRSSLGQPRLSLA